MKIFKCTYIKDGKEHSFTMEFLRKEQARYHIEKILKGIVVSIKEL